MNWNKPQPQARQNRHSKSDSIKVGDEGDLETLLDSLDRDPFVLILDRIQDVHNLGACMRTANGAGIDAVIITKDKSAPVTDTVVSVSCGATESTPVIRVTNLARTMKKLRERGIWLMGTSDRATEDLYAVDLTGPLGIVMGNEADGLRRLSEENCDLLISIPMQGKVPCLNVSVATAVCLFEALRQRI